MDLRERKLIINGATESLPEYSEGKWLHGVAKKDIPGMVTTGINFAGATVNSFGPVKSSEDILTESGKSVGQGSGFSYLKQNSIDVGAQMDELSKLNTANTLLTASAGASLGSAFGPIGAGIGGVVGGAVGFIGGLFRKNKMAERIRQALIQATRNNNFNLASAQTDYLTNQYNVEHDNTLDDMLYAAKNGKSPLDSAMKASGFVLKNGRYVFDGHAMMSNGEAWGHIDPFTGEVLDLLKVGKGRDNKDTVKVKMGDTPEEVQSTFVVTNKGGASQYTLATGDVAGGLQIGELLKMDGHNKVAKAIRNGVFDLPTDILTAKCGKLPRFVTGNLPKVDTSILKPSLNITTASAQNATTMPTIVGRLNDGRFITLDKPKYGFSGSINNAPAVTQVPQEGLGDSRQLTRGVEDYFKNNPIIPNNNDSSRWDNWGLLNNIVGALGIARGIGQMIKSGLQVNSPNIYANNDMARQGLAILASRRPDLYARMLEAYDAEARNRYNINRMGGLSAGQRILMTVAGGNALLKNLANIRAAANLEANAYRGELGNATIQVGGQNAGRKQTANQYNDDARARSVGASTNFWETGANNAYKAYADTVGRTFDMNKWIEMMGRFDQEYDLKRRGLFA